MYIRAVMASAKVTHAMAIQEYDARGLGNMGTLSDAQRYELIKSPNDSASFQGNAANDVAWRLFE